MRNKFLEAMFFMFMLCLYCSVGFANATEPAVTSDTVVSSTVSTKEDLKSAHNNSKTPVLAFVLAAPALKGREDLEESPRKTARHPNLVGANMSWAEYWSLPSDMTNYWERRKLYGDSPQEIAAHFKGLIKTAGKRHVRRQMRRAAFRANRAHCKKRRSVRAAKGDVKTSKGWINRKSFWTSPLNRALRAEAQESGLKITKSIQALIDLKAILSDMPTLSRSTCGASHRAFSAERYYSACFDGLATQLKEMKAAIKTAPSPNSETTEPVVPEAAATTSKVAKAAKTLAPLALGLVASLFVDADTTGDVVSMCGMITMSFQDYWKMAYNGNDTDYAEMREQAEKCLPDDVAEIEIPKDANRKINRKLKGLIRTLKKADVSDRDYCHSAMTLIEELDIETSIEVEKVETIEEQFNALISNENAAEAAIVRDGLQVLIENTPDGDEASLDMVAEYLYDLEKKYTYGNPRWKSFEEMLNDNEDFSNSKKAQLIWLAGIIFDGYRPEHAGNRYIKIAKDERAKLRHAIESSLAADYALTIKLYPSNDRTLKGNGKGHGSIPKIAITADIAWMSGYNALIKQYNEWMRETGIKDQPLNVKFGDVIFVQSLKDARGNETEIRTLNETIMALGDGYDAVTPGFWVKRGHSFGDWIRDIFVTNKEVRARSRSMATTPSQQGLHIDAVTTATIGEVNSTLVVAADLTKNGQPGADGANLVSRNYRLRWDGWLGQLRLHTNYHSVVTKALQCKGLLRRHKVWAVRTGNDLVMELRFDRDDRIASIKDDESLTPDEKDSQIAAIKAAYLPCIVMDIQNIKGRSSGEVKSECAKLNRGQALCLNTWSLEGNTYVPADANLTWEKKLTLGRFFGGILAEDYKGKSSTSWQQNQLFSPSVLRSLVKSETGEFREDVARQFNNLYGRTSSVVERIFASLPSDEERKKAQAAAMSQRGMSQRTVEAFVFGMKQKWETHYCDQMDMPQGWFITANKTHREGAHKYLAATGQPQLYHQCILHNKVMDHGDIRSVIKALHLLQDDLELWKTKRGKAKTLKLTKSQLEFLTKFFSHLGCVDVCEVLDRLNFIAGSFGRKGEDTLVWISKIDQDKMQRDSDGDRVLFSSRARDVKLAKLHNDAIAKLPVPSIEVGNVGQDGDESHLSMVEGLWADPAHDSDYNARLKANQFICAPNQGQGPTGQLVNQASALLNYVLWQDDNGTWAPASNVRDAALQLYAFVCLLIQNAIDRTKKPHAVPTLSQCFLLDLYHGVIDSYEVEGGEGNPANGTERWPAMVWDGGYELQTRNGFLEQYNTPVLKHWMSWAINMAVNLPSGMLFSSDRKWIGVVEKVAEIFHGNSNVQDKEESDEQYVARMNSIWKAVTRALGRNEDDFEEVREGWAWPGELYLFKKQASLEVPLEKAAPGLQIVSKMVVEENRKAKAKFSLKGNTMRQLYISLARTRAIAMEENPKQNFWENHSWGTDKSLSTFLSFLHSEIKRNRAGERLEKGQSEIMGNQKISDTAEYLKELKDAMQTGEWDFPAAKILNRAFNSKVKDRTASVSTAILMLAYASYSDYGRWAEKNDVMMAWAKEAYEGRYDDIIWGQDTEEVPGAPDENNAKGHLIRILADNYTYSADFKEEVLSFLRDLWLGKKVESDCTEWPELYLAGIESKNRNKDGTGYSAIWSQWIPALEEHKDLAEQADETRKYFIDGPHAREAIQYVMDGSAAKISPEVTSHEDYISQCIEPGFLLEIRATANAMAARDKAGEFLRDLSEYPGASEYRAWVMQMKADGNLANFENVEDAKMALYGLARKLKLAGDYRSILNMAKPIIQARRLRSWVDTAFGGLDVEKRNDMVRSAMINETMIQYTDPNAPSGIGYTTYRTLKGRPDAVVPIGLQVELFQGLLDRGLSFYALAPTGAIWFNFNSEGKLKKGQETGRKLTNKWVMYDSRIRGNGSAYNVLSLKEEFDSDLCFGDMFSCAELETWREILTHDLKNCRASEENQHLVPKIIKMLECINRKLEDAKEYYAIWVTSKSMINRLGFQDKMKQKFLYDRMAVPLHWGGNDKSALRRGGKYTYTTRTSAHRPIWRTIFAVMGDGEFTSEKGDAYNYLAGTNIIWGGKGKSKQGLDNNEALEGGFLSNGTGVNSSFYDRSVKTSFRGLREFLPFTTPGVERKVIQGTVTWIKVPRSPMNEYFGSIVIFVDGRRETAYLCGERRGVEFSENAIFLKDYARQRRVEDDTNVFDAMRDLCKLSYGWHAVEKVNGINAGWVVADKVFDEELEKKLPGITLAQRAELVLGCRHITVAWDSYVLLKWDSATQMRLMGKGTTAWKGFISNVGGSSSGFEVQLPQDADRILAEDLFDQDL